MREKNPRLWMCQQFQLRCPTDQPDVGRQRAVWELAAEGKDDAILGQPFEGVKEGSDYLGRGKIPWDECAKGNVDCAWQMGILLIFF